MNYEQFVSAMLECTKKKLSKNEMIERQEILKNNGVVAVGLAIRKMEESIAPIIYLEDYYKQYQLGKTLEELSKDLIDTSRNAPLPPHWHYEAMLDFQKVKDRIVYKLVNAKKNEKLLQEVPNLPLLDFAVIFYLMIPDEEMENCSVLIRNAHMNLWKLPISLLYQCAKENTQKLCPCIFCPLTAFVKGYEEEQDCSIMVLSNEMGINGAAAILYPGMPKRIYEALGKTYYLLPATIHEFLIVPETEEIRVEDLVGMVREINEMHVKKEEVLSDGVYYFDGNNITKM